MDEMDYFHWLSFKIHISITVYIQYYFVLISGVQHSGWKPCTLKSDPPDISSTHLSPYVVIIILLTIIPVMYFTSQWLYCNYQSIFLNPSPFSLSPITPLLTGNHQSVFCIYESVSILFVHLYCCLDSMEEGGPQKSWNHLLEAGPL